MNTATITAVAPAPSLDEPRPQGKEQGREIYLDERMPFDGMRSAFAQALHQQRAPLTQFNILLARYPVRIRVVGARLAEAIEQAFAHCMTDEPGEPELSIHLWDQQETGVGIDLRSVRAADAPPVQLKASDDGRYIGEVRDRGLCWLDRRNNEIFGCTQSAGKQYLDERARPVHKLLSVWLGDRGIQFIHGGLVARGDRGILFGGNGGAGKSTSSIACLRAGFSYLGDDFIGVQATPAGGFTGYGLFASCLINVDHLRRFPDLGPHAIPAYHVQEEKSVIYLSSLFPGQLEDKVTLSAIALPRVVDSEETSFRRASKGEALFALAPTSVMFLPSPNARALDRLAQMVERVPCFRLELGRNIEHIPLAVERLLAEVKP